MRQALVPLLDGDGQVALRDPFESGSIAQAPRTVVFIDGVGVWVGEVKTVPKLQAPGTCQANSATFASADASSYDAI